MPLDQTEAVVLKSVAYADQDKIVTFFSRDKGLLRGVAKGARKFGNRFGSMLEPMTFVQVFYYEKEHKDLVTISSCDLIESFFDIQKDPDTAFTLAYFAELIEEFFPTRAREDLVYRLLLATLQAFKGGGDRDVLARYFEAWFLQINGYLPDLGRCRRCRKAILGRAWLAPRRDGLYCADCSEFNKDETGPELARFVDWAKKNPPPQTEAVPFTAQELRSIRKSLQAFIVYHLEREPKTLHYLRD
jgi:DNA repair protein RecO (recombination protein O)